MVVKPDIPHIAGFFVLGFIEQRLCGGQRIANPPLCTAKRGEQAKDKDCGAGFYGLFFLLLKKLSSWAEAFF
jgi:hypothetical protein